MENITIRPYRPTDLDFLIALWLESTITGHPFIKESYWYESEPLVRQEYIPNATTWVYEHRGQLGGFISIMADKFIAALFVATDLQGKGVGKTLIRYAQACYPMLMLEVFQKNYHAHQFYKRLGFSDISEEFNQDVQEITHIMRWIG